MHEPNPSPSRAASALPAHGGNLAAYARMAGCRPGDILDFSASMNPAGPPEWLRREISARVSELVHYPDPECTAFVAAAAARYGVAPDEIVPGNGTSELLFWLPRLVGPHGRGPFALTRALIPQPAYADYATACRRAGLTVDEVSPREADGFAPDLGSLAKNLNAHGPALVLLGQPNNPTGRAIDPDALRALARSHPESLFLIDEAFADFVPGLDRLTRDRPANVAVLLSLTKVLCVPGLRIGLAVAAPELAALWREALPAWSVNALALAVGARGLADDAYLARAAALTSSLRAELAAGLAALPGLTVHPAQANFVLCRLPDSGPNASELLGRLLVRHHIAVRVCANFPGLTNRHIRVAVRSAGDNARLLAALSAELAGQSCPTAPVPPMRRTPAIMVQGTSSNAGKSLLAAALCRILLQDGYRPAPFKAQNMSLNSCVTADGREMGRAQALQAAACRLEPDARMNPVLLKPSSDTGSQVIVLGKPVGNMRVAEYIRYKAEAFAAARAAYDELAATADVMVIEGAGSPAETNLKAHDIVNMAMSRHADAPVLLVADIDRGGAFAGLVGTMECLDEWERAQVRGFVLNKFRGDASLLGPAVELAREQTGVPTLGVVPYLQNLGLPEEDSVSFKAASCAQARGAAELDIALIDLAHISNFTDVDALRAEPDAAVRVVRSPAELGRPDAVILPGSKNTIADLARLVQSGLARAILALPPEVEIVGICGGFQMLGQTVSDPLGLESAAAEHAGLGLLPVATQLHPDKTLARVSGTHAPTGLPVSGYEIHHGRTQALSERVETMIITSAGAPAAVGLIDRPVWGTYLHGVFDSDPFRRWFLDRLRERKGLSPLGRGAARYDIEPALDRLALAVRNALDMRAVYALLGLEGPRRIA